MSGDLHSGSAVRPCPYYAAGHVARPIRHWRRTPSVERNVIEALAPDGPDTLIIVIGRTCDLVNFPELEVERRMLRYSTHAAASIRYPLVEPYRYQPCAELVPDPHDPEAALELPYLEDASEDVAPHPYGRERPIGRGAHGCEQDRRRSTDVVRRLAR